MQSRTHSLRSAPSQRLRARTVGIPLLLVSAALLCWRSPLPYPQAIVAWSTCATVTLWISELIPASLVTVGAASVLVLSGVITISELISVATDPVMQLLLGSLVLALALTRSGLAERTAFCLLQSPVATRTYQSLLLSFGVVSSAISLFVSNTAVTAMMLPVGLTIIDALQLRGRRESIGLLLMLTWGSSVAVGVLVGSPPNLIAQRALQTSGAARIGFLDWMTFGMPVNLLMLAGCWWVLRTLYFPEPRAALHLPAPVRTELGRRPPFSPAERRCFQIFVLTTLFWVLPDLLALLGENHWIQVFRDWVTPSTVAVGSALLLFTLPVSRQARDRVLAMNDLRSLDWRTMFLFGGGLLLGQAAFDSGLAGTVGRTALEATGATSQLAVTALLTGLAILLSELTSNTAAAALLTPLAITLTQQAGLSSVPATLGVALGTSLGFMMPISTPPNSIVYSSGLVPMREMIRSGLVIDLFGFVVVVGTLRGLLPLLGMW